MSGVVRSLRFRLVAGFTLVAAASALGAGALTFREARTGVLQQSQDMVVDQFRDSVDAAVPPIASPLDQSQVSALVDSLAATHRSQHWLVLATYRSLRASSASTDGFDEVTPELRRSVGTRSVAVFQRVRAGGAASLVVGLPVLYESPSGAGGRSGLVLYLVVPQTTEQGYVTALVGAVERATLPALGLAVLLALFVARGVLRPVRALRQATRRMAAGHLDTRLTVQGSDELAELSAAFNETAVELERSVAELRRMEAQARRFSADVSHELRTPLAAMAAVTDVLDEESARLEGETAEAVSLISEETGRLVRLVNDLMEISRFDAGAAELSLDEIDMAESVQRTLAARGWQDQVDAVLPAPGALRAAVDPRRFDVVVANLVGNALRHGDPPVTVELAAYREASGARWVRLTVTDSGPGIGAMALPHIFERFYKAGAARTRSESSGLGLAITAENVRLHGGRVRARNAGSGGGAVLTVELPADRAHGDSGQDHGAGAGPGRGAVRGRGQGGRLVRPRRAWGAAGATVGAAVLGLLVAGCGVPTSGVIDVGSAASGLPAPRLTAVTVYLLHGKELQEVTREVEGDDDPVAAALEQLLAGPSGEEGRKGLTTSVPEPASVLQLRTGEDTVAVTLAAGTAEFDDTALRQLACTAAVALNRQRAREVPPAQAGGSAAPAVPMPTEPPVTVTVTVTVTVPGPGWQRVEQSDGCPSEAVAQ